MSLTLEEKVAYVVRQRGGLVGPMQLWAVIDDRLELWHPSLGPLPTEQELSQAQKIESAITAEQHLTACGFGGERQPALIYLLLQLNAAGKTSVKLNQAQQWMNQVLFTYASDQMPRTPSMWGSPPHSYEEVVVDATTVLQTP